jgi:predicted TIM-barrel fold metal-dependent hydrolase
MQIIDTHLHLIYLDRFRYPWLDGVPALNRDFTLETYLAQARALGIDHMLHMEVDVAEADIEAETAFATGIARGVIGAIAACRPEADGFEGFLERACANPRVRGFRRVLHTGAHPDAETPRFVENLRRLARYRRTFDLCVPPEHIPLAAGLAKACPEVQFVLDHCGVPDIKNRALDPWRAHIRDIAGLPNVACKISGIVAYGHPTEWTLEDLRPYVEHVIACFGWDRLVWGSDWPVCTLTADLGRWVAATHDLIKGASEDEKERLLSRNATRIYGLGAEQA